MPVGGGGGGRIGLIELPTGATPAARAPPHHPAALHPPALLHPAPLQDWAFDPFRDDRLMVACDDGQVREWIVPDGGGYGMVEVIDLYVAPNVLCSWGSIWPHRVIHRGEHEKKRTQKVIKKYILIS